jgi:hypothetical protein
MRTAGDTGHPSRSAVAGAWRDPPAPVKHAPPPPTSQQPKLLDRLREALRSRHNSRLTERAYWHWACLPRREASRRRQVKRFIFFHLGTARPQGCQDHHDLHPRSKSGRRGGAEPGRPPMKPGAEVSAGNRLRPQVMRTLGLNLLSALTVFVVPGGGLSPIPARNQGLRRKPYTP